MSSSPEALQVTTQNETRNTPQRTREDQFDDIGWGLLFLLLAALALPSGVPEYALVASVGALMLGVNVARNVAGVRVRWFSIILGAVALVAGIGAMAGVKIDVFALFFFMLGVVSIVGAVVRSR